MTVPSLRVVETVPGTAHIGIEIPNDTVKRKTEAEEMSKRTTKLQSKIEQMLKSL